MLEWAKILSSITTFHTTEEWKGDWIRQDSMLICEIDTLMRVLKYFFSPACWFLRCDKSNVTSEFLLAEWKAPCLQTFDTSQK